ncbi:MAG: hypothetical protein JWN04_6629 [Myxococcaceae bacterium]|nr:hypothetical protein [Myxococcaceae bacterium]
MADFQQEVARRARSFDLKSLLQLLARYGYERDSVRFRGTAQESTHTLIQSVVFSQTQHEAVITVAMGLLGDSGLIPTYYLKEAEKNGRLDDFEDFISFFDHWLIRNYVAAVWPEDDELVYEDYPQLRAAVLGITGFSSLSTMKWLVELLFPDVVHTVSRRTFLTRMRGRRIEAGFAPLDGTGVLGGAYEVDVEGFLIALSVDEEQDSRGRAWATLLHARVADRLVPLVTPFGVSLRVELRIVEFESALHFAERYPVPGSLGYPVLGGRRSADDPLILFDGLDAEGARDVFP